VALGFNGAGIGNLTALEPYRPVFIGGALVAVVLAYRRIYRPVAVCAAPQARSANKMIFWGGGIGRGSRRLPLHSSFHCSTEKGTVMKKFVTLSVSGMTCADCASHVEKALQKIEGVEKTQVNYDKKEAVVTYDNAKTGVEALKKATDGAGYLSEVRK
jgi:periplasmic mercuric ion binding protein